MADDGFGGRFGLALRIAALVALAATAVQSVVVPRGVYADGAYNLWLVLNEQAFVVIGPARSFAILLNQLPIVLGLSVGIRDLDVLLALYSFGVAAVPVLIWAVALLSQLRDRFFWPLVLLYAAAFLNSGFIAIGEYTYAFALSALVTAVLVGRRRVVGPYAWAALLAAVALILSYEGMVFLGLPIFALAVIRRFRPTWLGVAPPSGPERRLLYVMGAATGLSVVVGAASIGIRLFDSADTNLAGAMNVGFALGANRQWQVSAGVALTVLLVPLVPWAWARVASWILLAAAAGVLFRSSLWSPAWLHYNTRSLATYTFSVLLVVAVGVLVTRQRVADKGARARRKVAAAEPIASGVAATVLLASLTTAFMVLTAGYGRWLSELQGVVLAGSGPIEISETTLYSEASSQYSWGWTNPYLSAVLQTRDGQGSVLSHVETIETRVPISPASTPAFYEEYHW